MEKIKEETILGKDYYTTYGAALATKLSRQTLYKLAKAGKFEILEHPRGKFYEKRSVEKWVENLNKADSKENKRESACSRVAEQN